MTTDEILTDVLRQEGGFSHYASDHGGPTNYGITQQTLSDWRGRPVTVAEVEALTEAEARAIYRRNYVEGPGFDKVADDRLRALLVDYGVHSGPRRAVRALQASVGVTTDGVLGPATLAAVNAPGAAPGIYRLVLQARGAYIADILQREPSQRAFAAGWLRRLMTFV